MKTSLGLLEVAGLALAIEAADIMAKAANVNIAGIQRTNGSGWMLVSVTGDVAAVNAAIANGAELARRSGGWVASRVIPRPAGALEDWLVPDAARAANDSGGAPAPIKAGAVDNGTTAQNNSGDMDAMPHPGAVESFESRSIAEPADGSRAEDPARSQAASPANTDAPPVPDQGNPADDAIALEAGCNLCHDPACPRRKGEPRAVCIHAPTRGNE